MRICLAVAVVFALGMQAKAQDIGNKCAAEAHVKELHGKERVRFEAWCKVGAAATRPTAPAPAASKLQVINANRELSREQHHGNYAECLSNSTIIGACPVCVAILWFFEDDRHCYVY